MNRIQRIAFAHRYCMPEVELQGGIRVQMDDAQAATYAEARKKEKQEREGFVAAAGAAKAVADAATAAQKKAEEDKALTEATKTGEITKIREIASKEATEKLNKFLSKAKVDQLGGVLAKAAPTLDSGAHSDILSLLGPSVSVDTETGDLRVLDVAGQLRKNADGTPVTADAAVREFLSARKHFQYAVIPAVGNAGGSGGGSGQATVGKITQAEYDAAMKTYKAQDVSKALAAGTLILVD